MRGNYVNLVLVLLLPPRVMTLLFNEFSNGRRCRSKKGARRPNREIAGQLASQPSFLRLGRRRHRVLAWATGKEQCPLLREIFRATRNLVRWSALWQSAVLPVALIQLL